MGNPGFSGDEPGLAARATLAGAVSIGVDLVAAVLLIVGAIGWSRSGRETAGAESHQA
ncbi:MAG: hypothetical protein HZY73_04485 [Micropruina sp.]|nr:MAG: hypothetical protein HZY73_04485 [Micropruina sp.]